MTLKIVDQKNNPLLKREEIYCIFEHPDKATPSRNEMIPALEKTLNTKREMIIIDKIFSVKGKGESKVHIFVYKKKEDVPKDKLEKMQKRMEKKGEGEEPAKEEEKPKEGHTKKKEPEGKE